MLVSDILCLGVETSEEMCLGREEDLCLPPASHTLLPGIMTTAFRDAVRQLL